MNGEQLSQPASSPEAQLQPTDDVSSPDTMFQEGKPKKWLVIGLAALALAASFATGIFAYQNYQLRKQAAEVRSTPIPTEKNQEEKAFPTMEPTVTPREETKIDWETRSLEIIHESGQGGKRTLTMEMKIPEGWTLQSYSRQENPGDLIKNCSDYVITSPTVGLAMALNPICSGWVGQGSTWPANATITSQWRCSGNDGLHQCYRVRYPITTHNYNYVDAVTDPDRPLDQSKDQVMDALVVRYAPPNESKDDFFFIPVHLTATCPLTGDEKENCLAIADQIAASLILR